MRYYTKTVFGIFALVFLALIAVALNEAAVKTAANPSKHAAVQIIEPDHTLEEATKVIETIESEEALILIHALDSRKGIKTAASERAYALTETTPPAAPETTEAPGPSAAAENGGGEP